MLKLALFFLIVAVVAAVFGFGGIAVAAVGIAKILFFIFLVCFVIFLIVGLTAGKSRSADATTPCSAPRSSSWGRTRTPAGCRCGDGRRAVRGARGRARGREDRSPTRHVNSTPKAQRGSASTGMAMNLGRGVRRDGRAVLLG